MGRTFSSGSAILCEFFSIECFVTGPRVRDCDIKILSATQLTQPLDVLGRTAVVNISVFGFLKTSAPYQVPKPRYLTLVM